jgi:adenylate cyclase
VGGEAGPSPFPALDPWLAKVAEVRALALGLEDKAPREQLPDVARIVAAAELLSARLRSLTRSDDLDASRVRHDLRTPLNHVLGYAEMLSEDLGGTEAGRDVGRVLRLGRQVLDGIDELVETVVRGGRHTPPPPATRELRAPAVVRERGGRILVADDNDANADLLRRMLARMGHQVTVVTDGAQALAALGRERFDLLLLDIVMPNVDGFEVLRRCKADERLRDVPVVMISSMDESSAVARCIELGAADHLPKPFEPVLLRARVAACLEARRLRDNEVEHLARLERERERTRELLRAILPDPVVEELETTGSVKPRRHEQVAVLFADIVGFTSWCDTREPEEVLPHLQRLVETWERTVERHHLQKIKTIGDGFLAVGGLLEVVEAPVAGCVRCGQDMLADIEGLQLGWSLRVGIHVGPVVAGLLGHRRFQYDLWGDTVNTAARVEHHGVHGGITLSAAAWEALRPLEPRGRSLGRVAVKGKGDLELFAFEGFSPRTTG